ncbi:MAG: hypothetical protein O9301_06365 [Leptospira sp.]|nr:hypothetical protein [Leptospira sp.]
MVTEILEVESPVPREKTWIYIGKFHDRKQSMDLSKRLNFRRYGSFLQMEWQTYFVGKLGVCVHYADKEYSDTFGRLEYKLGEWNGDRDSLFETAISTLGKFATKYVL